MPLITALHFCALSAGIRPGNAVFRAFAVSPHVFASALAMSMSKPLILPVADVSSMGGKLGSVQNVNVACRLPPADVAATAAATSTSIRTVFRIALPPFNRGKTLFRKGAEREQVERHVRGRERRGRAGAIVGGR